MNDWVNNREDGDLRRHRAHYDVTVIVYSIMYISRCYTSYPLNTLRLEEMAAILAFPMDFREWKWLNSDENSTYVCC